MVVPSTAVGLATPVRGVRRREEIKRNLEHTADLMDTASWLSSLDLPVRVVRLVAIPEGALQGFTDEVFDLDHAHLRRGAGDRRPGEETAILSELARHWNVFISPGQGPQRELPRPLLQPRLHHRPGRRGDPEAPQAGDPLPGGALGRTPRRLGPRRPRGPARRPGRRSVPCGATFWAHIACQRCAATRSTGQAARLAL